MQQSSCNDNYQAFCGVMQICIGVLFCKYSNTTCIAGIVLMWHLANFQCKFIQLWMMIIKRFVQLFKSPFNPITYLWVGRLHISWSTVWGLRQAVSKNDWYAYPLSPKVAPRSNQLLPPFSLNDCFSLKKDAFW